MRTESKYMIIWGHMGGNCIIVHTWSSEIKDWTETLKQTKSLHHFALLSLSKISLKSIISCMWLS